MQNFVTALIHVHVQYKVEGYTDRHTDATLRGSFLASCKGLLKEWRVSKILRAVWLAAPSLGWEEGWGRTLSLWEVNWKWKQNNENVHVQVHM